MTNDNKVKPVYTIVDRKDRPDKPDFRRVGTAFVNKDHSLNVQLDAVPVDGRLHIRDFREKTEESELKKTDKYLKGQSGEQKVKPEKILKEPVNKAPSESPKLS